MMLVLAAVFRGELPGSDVDFRLLFIAGMIAVGVMSATFQSLAISITSDREEGIIRRLAASPMPRSAPGAATPPFMVLQIISGVFFPIMMIPALLRYIGYAFPLLWMAKGLRFVVLPDAMKSAEPNGSWDLGMVALMLIGWTIVGGVLSAFTFRWRGQRVK